MTKTFVSVMAGHRPVARHSAADGDSPRIPQSGPRITKPQRIKDAATYGALRIYTRILKTIGDASELPQPQSGEKFDEHTARRVLHRYGSYQRGQLARDITGRCARRPATTPRRHLPRYPQTPRSTRPDHRRRSIPSTVTQCDSRDFLITRERNEYAKH